MSRMNRVASIAVAVGTAWSLASCQSAGSAGPQPPAPEPGTAAGASAGTTDAARGPYTAEQATRGEATFEDACSRCHEIARFSTADFFRTWTRAPLNQLYGFISTSMPRGAPGSLSRAQYADVVAYLLSSNGVPPGATDLPANNAALARIRIAAPSP